MEMGAFWIFYKLYALKVKEKDDQYIISTSKIKIGPQVEIQQFIGRKDRKKK